MNRTRLTAWAVVFGLTLALQGCPKVRADPPDVLLPANPPPVPPPTTTPTLAPGQTYLVKCKVAATVIASPDLIVEVCPRKAPISIDATFWPSTTATLADFDASYPFLYLVRPKGSGNVELIIVSGATVIRQPLIVGAPTPPTPPNPPTDPLTTALQAAYLAETDAAKLTKLNQLATYYAGVIAAEKGKVATLAALEADIKAGADVIAGAGGMPALRKVASEYIAGKLPKVDGPMNDALWSTAAAAYGDISTALSKLKR